MNEKNEKKRESKKNVRLGQNATPGMRLKALMEEKGISQAELGRLTDISKALISRYVMWGEPNGKGRTPRSTNLQKIAEVLRTTPDYLMLGDDTDSNMSEKDSSVKKIVDTIGKNKLYYEKSDKMTIVKSLL